MLATASFGSPTPGRNRCWRTRIKAWMSGPAAVKNSTRPSEPVCVFALRPVTLMPRCTHTPAVRTGDNRVAHTGHNLCLTVTIPMRRAITYESVCWTCDAGLWPPRLFHATPASVFWFLVRLCKVAAGGSDVVSLLAAAREHELTNAKRRTRGQRHYSRTRRCRCCPYG